MVGEIEEPTEENFAVVEVDPGCLVQGVAVERQEVRVHAFPCVGLLRVVQVGR